MPTYEIPLLLKIMTRPELVTTLKRTAEGIFNKGGFIRKLENLGTRKTPFRISAHQKVHKEASYFLLMADLPSHNLEDLKKELIMDIDVVRFGIYSVKEPEQFECTLDEEIKPAAYRKDVQELVAAAKKRAEAKQKKKFKFNSGFDYDPLLR